MFGLRRCTNIKTTLCQCILFAVSCSGITQWSSDMSVGLYGVPFCMSASIYKLINTHRSSPSSVKFETLLNVTNRNQLYKLCKFIENILLYYYVILTIRHLQATMFFLCRRSARALDLGRALEKKLFFFCPARALDCCRFPKKTVNFGR